MCFPFFIFIFLGKILLNDRLQHNALLNLNNHNSIASGPKYEYNIVLYCEVSFFIHFEYLSFVI